MVEIYAVEPGSLAELAGLRPGDFLISINGHEIADVLDYRFYLAEPKVTLKIHRGPELFDVTIKKGEYEDIGLEFQSYLMDEMRRCRNKCIFCFIDQLPPGMRESLYFKDDDARMSFLLGNYITLTNLTEKDVERIILMRTSPLNISVHTTNPELRVKMLQNKRAGNVLALMRRFAKANIKMNCQIVLCKGVNDEEELDRTMADLASLWPAVQSVSVVPAGLTKYREGLFPLEPYSPEECARIIGQVSAFAERCMKKHKSRIFFCADELYVKAGLPIPPAEDYEGYPQLENGVGMLRLMQDEFDAALRGLDGKRLVLPRDVSIATGEAAYGFICGLVDALRARFPGLICKVYKIKNDFFGENITVAGLITGIDLFRQLCGKHLGDALFLPKTMLRSDGDMFLDSMTHEELSKLLGVKIEFVDIDGYEFAYKILGEL